MASIKEIPLIESKQLETYYMSDNVEALLLATQKNDFFLKHKSFYLLKKKKEQETVPFLLPLLLSEDTVEADRLRILDIFASLEHLDVKALKPLFYDKNPYINRGIIMVLANKGSSIALEMLLDFAASNKGRIIKRELFGEAVGLMLNNYPVLESVLEKKIEDNESVRGYLKGMTLKPPKNGVLSIYPSHDYWALLCKENGYDYKKFKYYMQSMGGKKF